AVHRAGAGLLASADGADVAGVHDESTEVDLVGAPEVGQQHLLDSVPEASRLPIAQAVPTGHAATAAHLLRQVFPGEAGLEDEDDPGEDLAIIEEGASPFGMRGMRWEERLDPAPKVVWEEGLGHEASL